MLYCFEYNDQLWSLTRTRVLPNQRCWGSDQAEGIVCWLRIVRVGQVRSDE